MKNGCNFLTNSANSILPNSLSPLNNHSKEHNKFVLSKAIVSLKNKFHRSSNSNNIIDDNLSESPLKQIHHRLLTPLLIDSSFEPKKILTKEFNIFKLKSLIGTENVLPLIGKTILDAFGINDTMINISKLDSFLQKISNSYNINVPYHNSIHGSNVTQTILLFFLNSNAEELCATSMLDILSIFIAALGHDLGHPGLTNNYQINSFSDMAIMYNDISCLENYHISRLFRIVREKENNIFEKLSVIDYRSLRKRIVNMILATDMANHGKVMSVIKGRIQIDSNTNIAKTELLSRNPKNLFDEQQAFLNLFIHSAALAHNTKLFSISIQWVELLTKEFWLQGDKEKNMNLPISFLCDRIGADIPSSQVGFIKGFVLPTFDVLIQMFPSLHYTVDNAKNNLDEWEKMVEEHRKTGWTPREKEESVKIKKTFTAIWGKIKLIIVHKRKGSGE